MIGNAIAYIPCAFCERKEMCSMCELTLRRNQIEWISVEERLPEEKVNCLVHYKHAYCDNDGYWSIGVSFYDGHKFQIRLAYKITHWMPLPMPPKGDEGK